MIVPVLAQNQMTGPAPPGAICWVQITFPEFWNPLWRADRAYRHQFPSLARSSSNRSPGLVALRASTTRFGLPRRLPLAFAFRRPAFTLSTMSERSSSAAAPRTVNTILPAGVLVSICSENETNSMPWALNDSRARSRWLTERAKRSNFQTTTQSKRRRCASAISLSSSGRISFAPEAVCRGPACESAVDAYRRTAHRTGGDCEARAENQPHAGMPDVYRLGNLEFTGDVALTMVPGARHARYCHKLCSLLT